MKITLNVKGLLLGAALSALACTMPAFAQDPSEAPALAERVAAGELPPVSERLPDEPMVIEPRSIGEYGGNMRTVLLGGEDYAWFVRTIFYDGLVRWNEANTDIEANLAESWEVNEDATVYTIHLRPGTRWSDGEPFTSADIAFWWELFGDDTVNPGKDPYFAPGGELAQFEVIDDYTFRFTFAEPSGRFMQRLANPEMATLTSFPRHVASRYYPDYNPEADALAQAKGFDSGKAYLRSLFPNFRAIILSAEFPVLTGWRLTSGYDANSTVLTAERNPYYYKVDTEGNQLPYIDTVTFEIGTDAESLLIKAQTGGIDLLSRHINTINNKSVLLDGQERGDYSLYNLTSVFANKWALAFNLTTTVDDLKREIFNNRDFRVAMSHAIDRQKIIDTVYFGLSTPAQVSVPASSEFYNEQLATQYTEFDPETANRLLDEAGLDQRDGEGYRLDPEGRPFVLSVLVMSANQEWIDVLELVSADWNRVGIRTKLDIVDRSLMVAHQEANDYEAIVIFPEGGGGQELKAMPRWFVPANVDSGFGMGWYYNFIGDPRGDDWTPPENIQQAIDTYRQMLATADVAEQDELVRQYVQLAADSFLSIGIAAPIDGYGIVSNRMRNVPLEGMYDSFEWTQPAAAKTETFWIQQ